MSQIPVSLQLYTLRNETSEDFIGTLKKVAEIGYKYVEMAGYGDLSGKELKSVLDGLGLQASSSHIGLPIGEANRDNLKSELAKQMEINAELGSKYLITPWAPITDMSDEQFAQFVSNLQFVGEECKRNGFVYAYHNHAFELELQRGGKAVLDFIYDSVDAGLLQAELDLYWVKKGGQDPKAYVRKYAGRCPLLHVKDMADDAEGSFAEVGHGIIDYPSVFAAAGEAGVKYYVVEQDVCKRPPLESVQMSFDYLKSIGIA